MKTIITALFVIGSIFTTDGRCDEFPPLSAAPDLWTIHFQATTITQGHPPFHALYSGPNSLSAAGEIDTSFTSTLYLGARLWRGAEAYFDSEISGGSGLSHTLGVAGFPNGEIYRVDTPDPKLSVARIYLKQSFGFGGEKEHVESELNQLNGERDTNRLTVWAGRFSLADFFDDNTYSHDARSQFMNWALMDNGAWDYAADTRGYTWGLVVEYRQNPWAVRLASALEPKQANQMDFDHDLAHARGDNAEFEYGYALNGRSGRARALAYLNHADMGSYAQTVANPGLQEDITLTRAYRVKYGFGINLEQELTGELGAFLRAGWDDGHTETWTYTEIDRTMTLGFSLRGAKWSRPQDFIGFAGALNGLSPEHAAYLRAGGHGFIIGDGGLSYALEEIFEVYYLWQPFKSFGVSGDFQFVNHPAYNAARGPASVFALRLHYGV